MLNCFCSMIDKQKVFSLTSSWNYCQSSSLLLISNMLGTGLELVQNLSFGLVEQSCAIVITTTPRHQTGTGTCTYFDIKINYYKKNNDGPTYISKFSNHPKNILQWTLSLISTRTTLIFSNENAFPTYKESFGSSSNMS